MAKFNLAYLQSIKLTKTINLIYLTLVIKPSSHYNISIKLNDIMS